MPPSAFGTRETTLAELTGDVDEVTRRVKNVENVLARIFAREIDVG